MQDENKRNIVISFRVNDEEKLYIEKKFCEVLKLRGVPISECGGEYRTARSMSDFIRKSVVFSRIIPYPEEDFIYLKRQLAGACSNLNQIAKIANTTATVTQENFNQISEIKGVISELLNAVLELENRWN